MFCNEKAKKIFRIIVGGINTLWSHAARNLKAVTSPIVHVIYLADFTEYLLKGVKHKLREGFDLYMKS